MSDENNTQSTAMTINDQSVVEKLLKEVQDEFVTSDREVYKAGLRSLMIQEQKLLGQIAQINADIAHLHQAREALTTAFMNGSLHSVSDARGVVRKVNRNLDLTDFG